MKQRQTNDPASHTSARTRTGPTLGMLEWFQTGEHDRVQRVLKDLRALNVRELRTGISWADCCTPAGDAWYAWLLPELAREVNVLPCFIDTQPRWGVAPTISPPPGNLKSYADSLDVFISKYGKYFEWIELWNEPNDPRNWDAELDPYWLKFSEMIGNAAYWTRHRGKKTVLGGMRPVDPNWLRVMGERGLLQHIDAVGVHAFPGSGQSQWEEWKPQVDRVREVLAQFNPAAQVWITETGYSTWRHDEHRQIAALVDALNAPVERVYWYSLHDLDPRMATGDGFHADERDYHYGLKRADGSEKLLCRLWSEGGLDAVHDAYWLSKSAHVKCATEKPVLITGGCGFIGTNLAHRLMSQGRSVLIYDNLSRPGVERNLAWLRRTHGDLLQVEANDVQDPHALRRAVEQARQVFHFAAQVAVTTSLVSAIHDFDVNARGTLTLLEAIRRQDEPPPLVFTSTNKVYGALPDIKLRLLGNRYEPEDPHLREHGVSEQRPLDFHSPYGCSKGAADQYILDYARTFGLPTAAFRMSCIYGPHQFGTEDQGWVAHFLLRAIRGEPITIYGDGKQVRDILYIDDLVNAFLLVQDGMPQLAGNVFNIGGGPSNSISLLDLLDVIHRLHGARPQVRFSAWRPGDQRYYISDTSKMRRVCNWQPAVGAEEGIRRLYDWLLANARRRTDAGSADRPGLQAWPEGSRRDVNRPRARSHSARKDA